MKRRISDIMDGFRDGTVELESSTPLSSERIKELTMSKITKKEKSGKRIVFRVLVAAAVISLMTVTAFAAEAVFGSGDLFRSIFNDQLKKDKETVQQDNGDITVRETVSQGQIDVVNELGKDFQPVTKTSEGTTVTLKAAYADANMLRVYLSVEAPEGTVLPDGVIYQFADWKGTHWQWLTKGQDAQSDPYYADYNIEVLPDENPNDNKKEFCLTGTREPKATGFAFNDGVSKFLNIAGIYQQIPDVDGDEDGFVLLAPGSFTFDVGIVNEVQTVDVNVDGLTYGGQKTRTWTHDSPCLDPCQEVLTGETDPDTGLPIHMESWDYTVTPKSLKISPLSVEWTCDYTCSDERMGFNLQFQVVMKDGTSPVLVSYGGEYDGGNYSGGTFYFSTPIDLDEVDYILIGDPEIDSIHKVSLPNT